MDEHDISIIDIESYFFITENNERLKGLGDYLAIMDTQVTRIEAEQAKKLEEDLQSIPDSLSDEDQSSYIQWREDEYQLFQSTFAKSFRYSFIVLVWLVIEDELKRVCIEIQQRKGLVPQKWKSNGIFDQCKSILKEVAGVSIEKIVHWSSICDLQKIRNCIVHTSGFVNASKDKEHLIKLIERKHLSLQLDDYDGRLQVSSEFCNESIQNTSDFFANVLESAGIKMVKESEEE
jgi:hypothetical protein